MIQAVIPETLPQLETLLEKDDFIGMRMASTLRCYGLQSDVCRFYLIDNTAALMTQGSFALLCGVAQDVEEVEQFLHFAHIEAFQSNLTMLHTWRIEPKLLMRFTGCAQPRCAAEVDVQPNLWQLAQSGLLPQAQAEIWYADTCVRVNKGEADVFAVRSAEGYAAMAGVYCKGPYSVYLSAVATQEAHRKQGFAATLVHALCCVYEENTIYLLCAPAMRKFYERLGFVLALPFCEYHPQ